MNKTLIAAGLALGSLAIGPFATPSFLAPRAHAVLVLDYTHDVFFTGTSGNATAKAALEQAAADINAIIQPGSLAPLDGTFSVDTGNNGLDLDFTGFYTNPTSGSQTQIGGFSSSADEVRVFVGTQNLAGSTLGQGGFGAAVASIDNFRITTTTGLQQLADDLSAEASLRADRGGPIGGSAGGGFTVSGSSYSYDHDYGIFLGNIWFDTDTDNNGVTDSAATLEANWHFDHTTAVAAGKDDFYSVALHELLHVLGIGGSTTWDSQINGSDWVGTKVNEVASGINAVASDGSHLAPNLLSPTIHGGSLQEVVMDPNLLEGTRKVLTVFDAAVLEDLGYAIQIPEPATAALLTAGLFGLGRRRG